MSTKSPSIFDLVTKFDDLFSNAQVAMGALRLLSADVPALSIDEVVERGLLFAKTNPTEQEIDTAMLYFGFMELKDEGAKYSRREDPLVAALTWHNDNVKKQRQEFRARLKELVQSPVKAKKKHKVEDIKTLQEQLLVITSLDDQGRLEHKYYPRSFEAAYKHVLLRIYTDKTHQLWDRLRQCPHCQSYFLRKASKAGGRPRDYCTPECQKKTDQQKALIRQKAARKRK